MSTRTELGPLRWIHEFCKASFSILFHASQAWICRHKTIEIVTTPTITNQFACTHFWLPSHFHYNSSWIFNAETPSFVCIRNPVKPIFLLRSLCREFLLKGLAVVYSKFFEIHTQNERKNKNSNSSDNRMWRIYLTFDAYFLSAEKPMLVILIQQFLEMYGICKDLMLRLLM